MKEHFKNILNPNKRRQGFISLLLIFVIVLVTTGLVACQQIDTVNTEHIDNISLQNAGNSYTFSGNKLTIYYHNGESSTEVILPINLSTTFAEEQSGVYISNQKTVIVYGGLDRQEPVNVMISDNKGKTWNTYTINDTNTINDNFIGKRLGFISNSEGWLVLDGNVGSGTQKHYIYETVNGGKSWTQIGNANDIYSKMLTGASFSTKDIGFLIFARIDNNMFPTIYRTQNQGKTWEKLDLPTPKGLENGVYRIDALSPIFNGADGVLPIVINNITDSEIKAKAEGQYVTSDYGKTWIYDASTDNKRHTTLKH